jgi:hypothetical protein
VQQRGDRESKKQVSTIAFATKIPDTRSLSAESPEQSAADRSCANPPFPSRLLTLSQRTLLDHIPKQKHGLRVKHVNLFDFVLDYLKSRKLLDKAIQMQREKGDRLLKNALAGPLHESKLGALFAEAARPDQHDLVIVSGVGTVWPLFRTHSLLNNLHPVMGKTPLVVFYPGRYDGSRLDCSAS